MNTSLGTESPSQVPGPDSRPFWGRRWGDRQEGRSGLTGDEEDPEVGVTGRVGKGERHGGWGRGPRSGVPGEGRKRGETWGLGRGSRSRVPGEGLKRGETWGLGCPETRA